MLRPGANSAQTSSSQFCPFHSGETEVQRSLGLSPGHPRGHEELELRIDQPLRKHNEKKTAVIIATKNKNIHINKEYASAL